MPGEDVIGEHGHLFMVPSLYATSPSTDEYFSRPVSRRFHPRCSDDELTITKNISETLTPSVSMYPTCVHSGYSFLFHY